MLDQRGRRWAGVIQMLYKCFVFAGFTLGTGFLPSRHEESGQCWVDVADGGPIAIHIFYEWANIKLTVPRLVFVELNASYWSTDCLNTH